MDVETLFRLDGKVALVTGASSGLGAMIAEGFIRSGARVYICGRKMQPLEALAERLDVLGPCIPIACDISSEEDRAALTSAIAARESELHILVNNAGTSWGAPLDDFPSKGFEKVLGLNLTAPFFLIQALLPQLRAAARESDPARIINVSSIDGLRPPERESYSYSASKAGLIMLTRHLARRLAAEHISVNAIAPGLFETPMTDFIFDPSHPLHEPPPDLPLGNRAGRSEDIAAAAIYLAARAGAHLTGVTLPVSGGEATAQ
ncbi:SDR family NAD(P)-dependent oxidoreductase [Sphingobium chlorophenolicum]|uniref:SDR-family protein n=1 Tax=Sphingobium chlorophenolicum TaxID=46429 RepID=A0A081R9Z6_SPHCR|nr:SDR family NAD(P)-dependent oxidoreductase [Sphingobium chlorophenolicum]KEQ52019.1 SDR-family protein [Sphingobium chlorophenolicum]